MGVLEVVLLVNRCSKDSLVIHSMPPNCDVMSLKRQMMQCPAPFIRKTSKIQPSKTASTKWILIIFILNSGWGILKSSRTISKCKANLPTLRRTLNSANNLLRLNLSWKLTVIKRWTTKKWTNSSTFIKASLECQLLKVVRHTLKTTYSNYSNLNSIILTARMSRLVMNMSRLGPRINH